MDAKDFGKPNKLCFREDDAKWHEVPAAHASILVPFGGHTHVSYVSPHQAPGATAVALQEYAQSFRGYQFLPSGGKWVINLPLAGSSAADVCYVVIDCGSPESGRVLWDQLVGSLSQVDVARWGGTVLTGAAAGNANLSNGAILGNVNSLLRVYDDNAAGLVPVIGARESIGSALDLAGVVDFRESGYPSSVRGRRYTVKSPNLTGVAAATAFSTTTPTFLLVNAATNEAIIRRITVSLNAIGTSTGFAVAVKTDTADRFSAGGTTRTPATMNNGNVVAASQARSLEAPTATAEGGGTRDIDAKSSPFIATATLGPAPIEFNFKDGLIIVAGGSLLVFAVTPTAGATVHYVIEYEDANVQ